MVYTEVYTEKKEDVMTTITPELKTFMEDLWGAKGKRIATKNWSGRIESVRTKAGIDLEALIILNDSGNAGLFSGLELFEKDAVIR